MIFIRSFCIVSVLCINDMKQNPNAQCSIRGEHENIVLTQGRNVMVMMTYLCLFAEITFFTNTSTHLIVYTQCIDVKWRKKLDEIIKITLFLFVNVWKNIYQSRMCWLHVYFSLSHHFSFISFFCEIVHSFDIFCWSFICVFVEIHWLLFWMVFVALKLMRIHK